MTRPGGGHVEELNPLKQKQAQITIKHQAPAQDKNKQHKQKAHTKEELKQARVCHLSSMHFFDGYNFEYRGNCSVALCLSFCVCD